MTRYPLQVDSLVLNQSGMARSRSIYWLRLDGPSR